MLICIRYGNPAEDVFRVPFAQGRRNHAVISNIAFDFLWYLLQGCRIDIFYNHLIAVKGECGRNIHTHHSGPHYGNHTHAGHPLLHRSYFRFRIQIAPPYPATHQMHKVT